MSDLESRIASLERSFSNIPLRVPTGGGGGGGLTFYQATTRAALPTTGVSAPALGYTKNAPDAGKYWAFSGGDWIGLTHLA